MRWKTSHNFTDNRELKKEHSLTYSTSKMFLLRGGGLGGDEARGKLLFQRFPTRGCAPFPSTIKIMQTFYIL